MELSSHFSSGGGTMSRNFTKKGLDQLAQNVLKQFDPSLVSGEPRAVPIESLAEEHYQLHVLYETLTKNEEIHGMTAFEDNNILIYNRKMDEFHCLPVNRGTILIESALLAKNRENRLRFTMAHEIAHWILHQEVYTNGHQESVACQTSYKSSEKVERQADYLAAALLMPYGRVKLAFARLGNTLVHEAVVYQLADQFRVSPEAMAYRLRGLNLYGRRNEDETAELEDNRKQSVKPLHCPHCDFRVLSVHSGEKPFAPETQHIELAMICPRCQEEVRLVLENS